MGTKECMGLLFVSHIILWGIKSVGVHLFGPYIDGDQIVYRVVSREFLGSFYSGFLAGEVNIMTVC